MQLEEARQCLGKPRPFAAGFLQAFPRKAADEASMIYYINMMLDPQYTSGDSKQIISQYFADSKYAVNRI